MEGIARFVTWRNALEIVDYIYDAWDYAIYMTNDTAVVEDALSYVSDVLLYFSESYMSKYNITGYLDILKNTTDPFSDDALYAEDEILFTLVNAVFKFFKIQASKKEQKSAAASGTKDAATDLANAFHVYDLVFTYFFVAAGVTLITMAILMVLSKKRKVLGDWLGIGLRLVMGIGISLIATVGMNLTAQQQFLSSPWMVPCVMIVLLVMVLAEGILGWVLPAPAGGVEGEGHHHGLVEHAKA